MKQTGIWLDKDKAYIITLKDKLETLYVITSNIEHYHPYGGSGTRLKGGPQDVVQDSKYLEREKHQMKAYFKSIINEVKDTDELVIFGPAKTCEKLNKEIHNNHHKLSVRIKGVKKADSMTENQLKAWVRDFFS